MGESFGCACDRIHPTHKTELDHMFEVTESFLSLFFLHITWVRQVSLSSTTITGFNTHIIGLDHMLEVTETFNV